MNKVWIASIMALAGALAACGSDGDGSSSTGGGAGSGGSNVGGSGGSGGSDFGGSGGTGGSDDPYACHSTFTATGTATPATGDPVEVNLNEADGVQVVSGDSGNTRFEALYASDMPLAKDYMGPDYKLLIDVLDDDDANRGLEPRKDTVLGSHGAYLSVKYDEGFWHMFTLELDPANGDYVEIEEGTTDLSEVIPSPQIKASYQLSFKTYKDMGGTEVEATGTLTGRFDGCYSRHNDESGEYLE
jgi:hypothetical protein